MFEEPQLSTSSSRVATKTTSWTTRKSQAWSYQKCHVADPSFLEVVLEVVDFLQWLWVFWQRLQTQTDRTVASAAHRCSPSSSIGVSSIVTLLLVCALEQPVAPRSAWSGHPIQKLDAPFQKRCRAAEIASAGCHPC